MFRMEGGGPSVFYFRSPLCTERRAVSFDARDRCARCNEVCVFPDGDYHKVAGIVGIIHGGVAG